MTILSLSLVFTFLTTNVRAEDDAKIRATYELFKVMKLADTFGQTITKILDVQIKQRPSMAPFKNVMKKFFDKYMGWESLKTDMAKIYASKFTLDEINKLKAFYQTPLGVKMARLMPELGAEGAALAQRRMQANVGELTKMIAAEAARLKGKK